MGSIPNSREAFHVATPVIIRWGDMDSFGHVNNAVYFTFCESARIAYFDAVGVEAARVPPSHGPVLAQASLNFRSQVRYPASLEACARATRIGNRSFSLDYAIFDQSDQTIVAEGTSVIAWIDYAVGRSVPLPEVLIERIRGLEGPASGL